eukprot:904025-Pyramimonas_sp.AAC.1
MRLVVNVVRVRLWSVPPSLNGLAGSWGGAPTSSSRSAKPEKNGAMRAQPPESPVPVRDASPRVA